MSVLTFFKSRKKILTLLVSISLLVSLFAEDVSPVLSGIADTENEQQAYVENSIQKENFSEQPQIYAPTPLNHVLAFGEALGSSVVLGLVNRYARKMPYAYISWDSMYKNLTGPWVWDNDEFYINHLGHPYQGAHYYMAGAANNLPFWESALITLSNSAIWEVFAETEPPSYNDIITTTMGGISIGEIFHRLHFATKSVPILPLLFSPMDSLNTLITGKPANKPEGYVYSWDTTVFGGPVIESLSIEGNTYSGKKTVRPFAWGVKLNIVYGDPYALVTTTPFSHFTFSVGGMFAGTNNCMSVFSDGVLISFAPWERKDIKTTMGLTLHYDTIWATNLNYSANSLAFTTKQKVNLPYNWDIQWNAHLNWIVLSATDYYYLLNEIIDPQVPPGVENRLYDIGTGLGTKLGFSISQPIFGTFAFSYLLNAVWTIPYSVQKGGSEGNSLIGMGSVSYEHKIFGTTSLGIEYSNYLKKAYYKTIDDTFEFNQFFNIYIRTYY